MRSSLGVVLPLALVMTGVCLNGGAVGDDVKNGEGKQREAYVTLLYGDYLLPVRVLGHSLKLSGTQREMIVLCTQEVSMETRKILEGDGWTVKQTKSIPCPYTNHQRLYSKVFTKLLIWTLTEYHRIVFMDSDTLVYANIDELFNCGKFCAAYRHSDLFNSGVLVVKPDLLEFRKLTNKMNVYPSYDNADQGFLNYYYQSLVFAPMFNASNHHQQEEPMRLPAAYNADVGQYYVYTSRFFPLTRFKVLHHTLGPVKPWKWWAYPLFDLNWRWTEVRDSLQPSPDSPVRLILVAALNLLLFIVLRGLTKLNIQQPVKLKIKGYRLSITAATLIVLSYVLGFIAIPDSMHPHFAIPAFCLWTLFFLQLFCFCVCVVTRPVHNCECNTFRCTWVIGILPLLPLVVPLFISAFFTRVCVFFSLIALSFICSCVIFTISLDKAPVRFYL